MNDLKKYISRRRAIDTVFNENYKEGYQAFKIGVLLRQTRGVFSLTQEQIAEKIKYRNYDIT